MKQQISIPAGTLKKTGFFVLAVLCVTVIFAAGCTDNSSPSASSSASVGASATRAVYDPVVGVWRSPGTVYRFEIAFGIHGDTHETYSSVPNVVFNGTWQSLGDNTYMVTRDNGKQSFWTYSPATNTISKNDAPDIVYSLYQGVSAKMASDAAADSALFSGNGDRLFPFTVSSPGLWIFTLQYSGKGNFIVWLKDEQGNRVALLANEIGVYSGTKPQNLNAGRYFLNVTAGGPWTIKTQVS